MNWNDLDSVWKNGTFISINNNGGWLVQDYIIFTRDRLSVERYMDCLED